MITAQMSLFGESEEELVAAWMLGRYEDSKRWRKRDGAEPTLKDWLDDRFHGWVGGSFSGGGGFDSFWISPQGMELRGRREDGEAVTLMIKKEKIYRMFGIGEAKK